MVSSRMQNEIPALLDLARQHTETSRLALAGKLADYLLADHAVLNDHEKQLMSELIDELLTHQSPALRQALAQTFAHASQTPRDIAIKLAKKPIDVAHGILTNCITLTDRDLIQVVETSSLDHARAIAARDAISEAVADALIATGNIQIMQVVAENLGATLTPYAYGALTEAARLTNTLHRPLLNRPDLPPHFAQKLYWWVEKDFRREALARFGFSQGQLDQALSKAIEEKLDVHGFERHQDSSMICVLTWLEERGAINTRLLPQLLRLGHFRLFNMALGHINKLDLSAIDTIVGCTGGQMLAALCRNMGIDKTGFVSIFLLSRGARHDEQVVHPHELAQALRAFDIMSDDDARNLIHTWRINPQMMELEKTASIPL